MFYPKYTVTNSILKDISLCEVAKEIIMTFPLITAWENKLREEARLRTIHHTTHLEGNPLTDEQVKELLEGKEVIARVLDTQDIINAVNVLDFLSTVSNQIGHGRPYIFTVETILEIHRLATFKLLELKKSGVFRETQIVVKNSQTGEITYTPPPAAEVPYLMEDLINWINNPETKHLHPVLKAGIVHYEIGRIHPFVDANGRVARAVSLLLLYLDGFELKKFYSFEGYFDSDPMRYYQTLQAVSNQKVMDNHERDLTPWLEYFTLGVSQELNKIKGTVRRVSAESRAKDKLGDEVTLNERQMLIVEFLHKNKFMANKDFRKIFPDLSDDTVLREMKFLKQKGLLKKTGGTKKARYVLAKEA